MKIISAIDAPLEGGKDCRAHINKPVNVGAQRASAQSGQGSDTAVRTLMARAIERNKCLNTVDQ